MAAVSGVRCAQRIARPSCPLRSTLTPDTAAKALASRFNRAPLVATRHKASFTPLSEPMPCVRVVVKDEVLGYTNQVELRFARGNRFNSFQETIAGTSAGTSHDTRGRRRRSKCQRVECAACKSKPIFLLARGR